MAQPEIMSEPGHPELPPAGVTTRSGLVVARALSPEEMRSLEESGVSFATPGGPGGPRRPEGPRGPGGPRPPEGPRGPDEPERPDGEDFDIEEEDTVEKEGRRIVEQIIFMETQLEYSERYNAVNGPRLNQLYRDLQRHVHGIERRRQGGDQENRRKAYDLQQYMENLLERTTDPNQREALESRIADGARSASEWLASRSEEEITRATGLRSREIYPEETLARESVKQLMAEYENDETSAERARQVEQDLLKYIRAAKNEGMLTEVDDILTTVYKMYFAGMISRGQIMDTLREKIPVALDAGLTKFREKRVEARTDPMQDQKIVKLAGVWKAYIEFAKRRFENLAKGKNPEDGERPGEKFLYREGEYKIDFRQPGSDETRETYWDIGHYPKYYLVTAKTPEQFRKAKDTFMQMIRTGSLGKSPDVIYEHVNNFKDVFSQAASKQETAGNITHELMNELRLETEAQLYTFGADYSNETYNFKSYEQFMMAMALHEGPERFVRLARSGDGQVGAFLFLMDKDARMDLFHNSCGSRGQIGGDNITQHYLQDKIKEIFVEQVMKMRLKDYDPFSDNINTPNAEARKVRILELGRIEAELRQIEAEIRSGLPRRELNPIDKKIYAAYKQNIERIGVRQSDQDFKDLYEGFETGDAHAQNFAMFSPLLLSGELDISQLPERVRKSVQLALVSSKLKEGQKLTQDEKRIYRIPDEPGIEKRIYKSALEMAKVNFDIAFQLVGITGEKVRRGGGVLFVDRNLDNPHLKAYKLLETVDDRHLTEEQKRSKRIGRIITQLRKGKPFQDFTREDQEFYDALPDADKDYVDHMPLYLAEKFVQFAETWTKVKYADDSHIWNDPVFQAQIRAHPNFKAEYRTEMVKFARLRACEQIKSNGFEARHFDGDFPKTLQYGDYGKDEGREVLVRVVDAAGNEVDHYGRSLDKKGKVINDPHLLHEMTLERPLEVIDAQTGKRGVLKQETWESTIAGYKESGEQVSLMFDREGKLINVDFDDLGRVKLFDKPSGDNRRRINTHLTKNTRITFKSFKRNEEDTEVTYVPVEKVAVDFDTAIDHIYSRWTSHTYWGYQGENRHMITAPHIFEAARRIRAGISRPEDEDMLATQLLIIDPTLCRVKNLSGDQMEREITLLMAAVEESYQNHWRINYNLHRLFLPADGDPGKMRMGYNLEDYGGQSRFIIRLRDLMASQPNRFTRRLKAMIADMPMEISSMPDILGQDGVLGLIGMFGDEIGALGHQRVASQFAITKFISQMSHGEALFEALVGKFDEQNKFHIEGLCEKPTNNSDKLQKFRAKGFSTKMFYQDENDLYYAYMESLDRFYRVLKIMTAMGSWVRNAPGVIYVPDKNMYVEDGTFNETINEIMDVGSSRHSERRFYYKFMEWLTHEGKGGGAQTYPDDAVIYAWIYKEVIADQNKPPEKRRLVKDWLFTKMGR